MGNGYGAPAGDGVYDQLAGMLAEMNRRLREVETQRGTQLSDSVAQLRTLVNSFPAQLAALSASGQTWQGPVSSGAGSIQTGAGNISSTSGNITTSSGSFTTTSGYVFTPAGYAFDITYTRRSAWLGNDGRLGWASSTVTGKQILDTLEQPDFEAILAIMPRYYKRFAEIEKCDPSSDHFISADYHVATEWGALAEDFHAAGLWQVVIYEWDVEYELEDVLDPDGNPILNDDGFHLKQRVGGGRRMGKPRPVGLHYELIGLMAVWATRHVYEIVKDERAKRLDLDSRVAKLEAAER